MSDLKASFVQAMQDATQLPKRPDNNTLLRLYALYKQATEGDATGEGPNAFDFIARAKFDAWSALKGTGTEESMRRYIELVHSLRN